MKNSHVSIIEERQFITKEFADTLAGKTPVPYLRVHDPAQQALVALGQYDCSTQERQTGLRPYLDRMVHFWREISLAGLPCAGKALRAVTVTEPPPLPGGEWPVNKRERAIPALPVAG